MCNSFITFQHKVKVIVMKNSLFLRDMPSCRSVHGKLKERSETHRHMQALPPPHVTHFSSDEVESVEKMLVASSKGLHSYSRDKDSVKDAVMPNII